MEKFLYLSKKKSQFTQLWEKAEVKKIIYSGVALGFLDYKHWNFE